MEEINVTVIGAGVVGLAIAAELADLLDNIVVLEKHDRFGQETSSRNSEVIHSGLYYPLGSLKGKLCREGAGQLYDICARHSIPFRKTGKLIVAAEEAELETLEGLLRRGHDNGVTELTALDRSDILKREPNVKALACVYSPETGIIDSHSLMQHFYSLAEDRGVLFAFNSEVNLIVRETNGFTVGVSQENYRFKSRIVINAAGLYADRIAELAGIDADASQYRLRYCKGSYFSYSKASPVSMLVYPVPHEDLAGLGVHATIDLAGRLRFGPDTEDVDILDYKVDGNKRDLFYDGASRIIRGLDREFLVPDMAGIRPKIRGAGIKDFVIKHEKEKGLEGFINLIGIESPGLTAAPSIAKMVRGIISEVLS